jgi:hypothetical protein
MTRWRSRNARPCPRAQAQSPSWEAGAAADNVVLHGLKVSLGPDLRVMYPMNVMNFGIGGDVVANGPADPSKLRLAGIIRWPPSREEEGGSSQELGHGACCVLGLGFRVAELARGVLARLARGRLPNLRWTDARCADWMKNGCCLRTCGRSRLVDIASRIGQDSGAPY